MRKISKWLCAVVIILLLVLLGGVLFYQNSTKNTLKNNVSVDGNVVSIEYTSDELLGEYIEKTAKVDISTMTVIEGTGAEIEGTTITVSRAGVYYFTGTAKEGNIIVNADNQEVVLVLDNINITCESTSVINVIDAKKVTINIPEGTTSTITDGKKYTIFTEDDEPNATIFSKDDLTIDGKGTLVIQANYEDAIASKDGLKIVNTILKINSADDGIRGKDYVAIKDAIITIESVGKAIKATEDTDTSKGLIQIDSGTFMIESQDDALHSNNKIIIHNGSFEISAEDDGIHADSSIVMNNGAVHITKSYEGIEANYIEINGGEISIIASDDGININGGNDNMGMMRQDAFKAIVEDNVDETNRTLVINGGNITVESNGDGLDSNGTIQMNGGTVLVGGSTNGGNSALDYNNTLVVTGGALIAYGPMGMWQNPSNSSTQYSIAYATTGKAGDKVELKDTNGNVIINFEAKRSYGMICISTPELKQGNTYTLYINGEENAFQELTSIVTSNGNGQEGFGGARGQFPPNNEDKPDFLKGSGDETPQLLEGMTFENMPQPQDNAREIPNGERPQRPSEDFEEMRREGKKDKDKKINKKSTEINDLDKKSN